MVPLELEPELVVEGPTAPTTACIGDDYPVGGDYPVGDLPMEWGYI